MLKKGPKPLLKIDGFRPLEKHVVKTALYLFIFNIAGNDPLLSNGQNIVC